MLQTFKSRDCCFFLMGLSQVNVMATLESFRTTSKIVTWRTWRTWHAWDSCPIGWSSDGDALDSSQTV